jgi:lysozyme family protein
MADYKTAVAKTLVHEGGFQKDPDDHANWSSGVIGEGELIGTKYGITALDMPGVIIENITEAQAIAFYAEHYWKPGYSQIQSQEIADKVFDMGVLFGVGVAVSLLQLTLGVHVDGVFGGETLDSANGADPASLLESYKAHLITHAFNIGTANPHERKDIPGWGVRINS